MVSHKRPRIFRAHRKEHRAAFVHEPLQKGSLRLISRDGQPYVFVIVITWKSMGFGIELDYSFLARLPGGPGL